MIVSVIPLFILHTWYLPYRYKPVGTYSTLCTVTGIGMLAMLVRQSASEQQQLHGELDHDGEQDFAVLAIYRSLHFTGVLFTC